MSGRHGFLPALLFTAAVGISVIAGNSLLANYVLRAGVAGISPHPEAGDGQDADGGNSLILIRSLEDGGMVMVEYADGAATLTETAGDGRSQVSRYEGEEARELLSSWQSIDEQELTNLMTDSEPGEDSIDRREALAIAENTVRETFLLLPEVLPRFTVTARHMTDGEKNVWWIMYYPTDTVEFLEIGCYNVWLDAESGEVTEVTSAADGRG